MSNPTRPVWMLPATGAALATTASLIGGINVDDPNVVPSVKAKKLLRTLVLGAAAGLGAEAMLRGGGIAYRGLMSKSSSAEQIKRFRNKTLYSLIKQGAEGDVSGIPTIPESPMVPDTTPETPSIPGNPVTNVAETEKPATPPPTDTNTTPPPPTTTPPKQDDKLPWHRQSPLGFPNGYIGYGLGTLAGAGLLYHFLTEKKKRKPSGYLNSMGAGLLAGLLGYGLYDLSQGGFGTNKTKENPKGNPAEDGYVLSLPGGINEPYTVDENGNSVIPIRSEEGRTVENLRALERENNSQTDLYNNRNREPLNFAWYTSGNNVIDAHVNKQINWALNKDPGFSKIITRMVMGPSLNEAYYDKATAPEFQRNIQEYGNTVYRNAETDAVNTIQQILVENGVPAETAATQASELTNSIYNFYKSSPNTIPYRATALADDISTCAFNSNLAQFDPNNPQLPGYSRQTGGNKQATDYAISNTFPHIERRMGRRLSPQEKQTLIGLTNNLRYQMHLVEEAKDRGDYTIPGGQDYYGKNKEYQPWWYNWYSNKFGIGRQQEIARAHYATNDSIGVRKAQNDIKAFFEEVLSTPGELILPPPPQMDSSVPPSATALPLGATPSNPTVPATGTPMSPTAPINTRNASVPTTENNVPVTQPDVQLTPRDILSRTDNNSGVSAMDILGLLGLTGNSRLPLGENFSIPQRKPSALGIPTATENTSNDTGAGVQQPPSVPQTPSEVLSNTRGNSGVSSMDILKAIGLGTGFGAAEAGIYNRYYKPTPSPVASRPFLTTGSKPKPTGFISHSPQADALVEGAITPEEYLYPGITQEREAYSARIKNPVTGELDYEAIRKVSNEELTSLEKQFEIAKAKAQTASTVAERAEGSAECKILQEKINKVKPWTQLGGNASIPGAGNTANFTTPEKQLEEWINYKKLDNPISKELQDAYTNLNTRLNDIETFPLDNPKAKDLLKREAISEFLNTDEVLRVGEKNANPVFQNWNDNYTKALDDFKIGEDRLPWKYRVSSKEIASVADSPLKQAILEKPAVPGMSFRDAVTYFNDPELAKATKELKNANAHLQEVQKLNQAKIKAGIKPNPLDIERANRNIELAQNRIQQLKAKITYGHIYGEKTLGKDWKLLQNIPYTEASPADMVQKILEVRTPDSTINVAGKVPLNYNYAPVADKRRVLEKAIKVFGEDHPVTLEAAENFKTEAARIIKEHINNLSKRSMTPGAFKGKINNPGIEYLNELAKGSDKYLAEAANEIIAEVNKAGLPKPVVYSKRPASKIPSLKAESIARAPSTVGKIGKIFAKALTPAYLFNKGLEDVNKPYTNNKEKVFSKAVEKLSWAERRAQDAYDAAIAQGKSEDEAQVEASKAWTNSQILGGTWGLINRIPALAVETVNIPSYLYNFGEEGASLAGLKTDKLPVTDTDKITLYNMLGGDIGGSWGQVGEGIGQGMSNLVPIVGQTAKHVVARPFEVFNNAADKVFDNTPKIDPVKAEKHKIDDQYALYNRLWRQKAYEQGFTPDDLEAGIGYKDPERLVAINNLRKQLGDISAQEWNKMTPEARERAIRSMQLPTPKNNPNKAESRIPAKNITQDHFNLALSLVGKDDTTKIKALSKLSPFDQNAIIQIINDMENTVQY